MQKLSFKSEFIWWELQRILLNFILFILGVILLNIIQSIKPIKSHGLLFYYFDIIIIFGFFVNICYTIVYLFIFKLMHKFPELVSNTIKLRKFTFNTILYSGIFIVFLGAGIELLYRMFYK